MSNPPGPEKGNEPTESSAGDPGARTEPVDQRTDAVAAEQPTEQYPTDPHHDPVTEVIGPAASVPGHEADLPPGERRYTAPSGFDAGSTQKIDSPYEPATEVFPMSDSAHTAPIAHPKMAGPQVIPPRGDTPPPKPPKPRRSWGWVIAVVLVIAALVAIAVLGTLLLTRNAGSAASQEDQVRTTIENFDAAIQNGDLATLRSITCGATRDGYVNLDDRNWADTHARVAAAKQYPVVASIDQIVVNGDHAEANVTSFMAFAPQTRSTRSFDLQFRDDQWKICQAPMG